MKKKFLLINFLLCGASTFARVSEPEIAMDSLFTIKNQSSVPLSLKYYSNKKPFSLYLQAEKKELISPYLGRLYVGKNHHSFSNPMVSFPGAWAVQIKDHKKDKIKMRGWWGPIPGKWKYPWGK